MEQNRQLVIIGGSVFGAKVAEVAVTTGSFGLAGFIDDRAVASPDVVLGKQLGSLADFDALAATNPAAVFFIAIGDNYSRRRVAERISAAASPSRFPSLIHPTATVLPSAKLGIGCLVSYSAIIETGVVIGDFVLVNTKVSLSHHTRVGDFSSIAPCSALAGSAIVGSDSALGMGIMVHHGVKIGSRTVVGSLSLVNKDLPDDVVAMGIPARITKSRSAGERYL